MPTIEIARFHVTNKPGSVKAFASVTINGKITIHGCRIVEGSRGLFLSMPQEQSKKDNKWYDQVQITDIDLKALVQSEVIKTYEERTVKAVDGQRETVDDGASF